VIHGLRNCHMKKSLPCSRRKFLATTATGITAALLPSSAKAAIGGFADDLYARLINHCIGFQLTVSDKYGNVTMRTAGWARLPQDLHARTMSMYDKYNVASVSKTVTAAALIRALADTPQASLDSPFTSFLPSHWSVHSSLKTITFKQLLQHRSGFKFSGVSYAELKGHTAAGVNIGDIGSYDYNNVNYGIMRVLIPRLAGYSILQIASGTSGLMLYILESSQDTQLANDYIDYTQKKVWDKTGVTPDMACKPTDTYPALCYQYPPDQGNGGHFGDMTLTCGSRGWNASSFQLNAFQRTLHQSAAILPEWLTNLMIEENLGYDKTGTTNNGFTYYRKNGFYPGSMNPGELNSWLVGFGNGVHIALLINSQFDGPDGIFGAITKAFDSEYKLIPIISWPG
jgi:CubicO group peptidase (beta-lactamase class C family)